MKLFNDWYPFLREECFNQKEPQVSGLEVRIPGASWKDNREAGYLEKTEWDGEEQKRKSERKHELSDHSEKLANHGEDFDLCSSHYRRTDC